MQFSAKCNSSRITILTVVSYQALFGLSVYKIPAVYLSGAKIVCFCTKRDFGSPTNCHRSDVSKLPQVTSDHCKRINTE